MTNRWNVRDMSHPAGCITIRLLCPSCTWGTNRHICRDRVPAADLDDLVHQERMAADDDLRKHRIPANCPGGPP